MSEASPDPKRHYLALNDGFPQSVYSAITRHFAVPSWYSPAVGSGLERGDANDPLRAAGDHLFGFERRGIEFYRQRVGIDHREHDPPTGWNVQFGRLKLVAADGEWWR